MKKGEPITPTSVRYIKLGEGGKYESACFQAPGVLRLGYSHFPNFMEQGLAGEQLRKACEKFAEKLHAAKEQGYTDKGAATNHARQVADFYLCDEHTLWFTFAKGRLWWCFAQEEVRRPDGVPDGSGHERETKSGWSDENIKQGQLRMRELSGYLTKTAGYRGTICPIDSVAEGYLVRAINCKQSDAVNSAEKLRVGVVDLIAKLMRGLDPHSFELLVDLVFSRKGWRRVGRVGGTQKTVDIVLESPITGDKAFVQVKMSTNAREFQECKDEFLGWETDDKMYFVYYICKGKEPESGDGIDVVDAKKLAGWVFDAGLFDWLLKETAE